MQHSGIRPDGRRAVDETDVVVVGGGLAGLCSAVSAAEAGAEVVLLEAESTLGGSTVLSGGFLALADTPMQRDLGITDSPERLYADLRAVGGYQNDEALVRRYTEDQADLFRWLTERGGVFHSVEQSSGQSVPRSHQASPPDLIAALAEYAVDRCGVRILCDAEAVRLQRDGDGGRVDGVLVERAGERGTIRARAGVVLCSGGFSRSEELLTTFAPRQAAALRMGGRGSTGRGLRLAWALGADLRDMGFVKGTFGTHPSATPEAHEFLLAFYLGAIMVDSGGDRFVDESLDYKTLGDACLARSGGVCFQIFDRTVAEHAPPGVPLFDIDAMVERGLVHTAHTWEELGARASIPPDRLAATVAEYNTAIAGGTDPFGRDGLVNHAGDLLSLVKPPFYAFPSTAAVLATYCGLRVTPDAEVIDVFGERIDGLYAAGEIIGGFHGTAYMTGSSLGKAAVFGRIAGARAALRVTEMEGADR